ncbi:MAG: hypothetical protein KJ964_07050 [Verrucomicrobia bacterium]|nr:hypothetical protein [Verrucomicrobiota bacterium]MBU1733958.1 hypothetical protein [Verrucomicrobiota bacterium]MBU1856808.1 hypothetical protein [Verrucomicrobiota bacterium]
MKCCSEEKFGKVLGYSFLVAKTKNEERRTKNNSGVTLIGIIAAIVIMGLLGAGVLMLVSTGSMESIQTLNWGQSFYAAESGVSAARAYMATKTTWYTNSSTITGAVGSASFIATLNTHGGITSVGSKDEAQWTSIWRPTWHAMLVYGSGVNTPYNRGFPRYRIWDGSVWSSPSNASSIGNNRYINWVVVKACPKRDEYIAATIDANRRVMAQVWRDGSWGDLQTIASVNNAAYRGVDVAYESLSGDAMVVAADGDADPVCYVWNGAVWTVSGNVNISRAGNAMWVKLASDPVSDEIIVMVQNSLQYYTAQVWNGNAWGNENLPAARSPAVRYESMAVEYETSGDQAIIVSAGGTAGNFKWNSWNGTIWGTEDSVACGDDFYWASLVNDPYSDDSLLTFINTATADGGRVFWNGAAWGTRYVLDSSMETEFDRCIDGAFETIDGHAGHAVVAYGNGSVAVGRHAADPSKTTWEPVAGTTICSDDTATVQIRRTGDGKILALSFNWTDTQYEFSWYDGTNWSAIETLETAPSVTASPWKEPFMMAPQLWVLP